MADNKKKRQHPEGAKMGHRIKAIKNQFINSKAINNIATGLKKGFYTAIQTTGPAGLAYGTSKLAVMGVQKGKGKSRKSIMPGLTTKIKEIVQGGDSTKVANYTKWLNSFGGTPTNHPMSDYEHSMELKAKKKKKNK